MAMLIGGVAMLVAALAAKADLSRWDEWSVRMSSDLASARRVQRFNRGAIISVAVLGFVLLVAGVVDVVVH